MSSEKPNLEDLYDSKGINIAQTLTASLLRAKKSKKETQDPHFPEELNFVPNFLDFKDR